MNLFKAVVLVSLGLFLGGACESSCSIGGKLDGKKLEGLIKAGLDREGAVVKSVTCPTDVKSKKGAVIVCDVIAENGDLLRVTYEQTDGSGNVAQRETDEMLVMAKIKTAITGLLKRNEAIAAANLGPIECPPDRKAVEGGHFECTTTLENRTLHIAVDENDGKGNVTYAVVASEFTPEALAAEIVSQLAAQKIEATVDCGTAPIRLEDAKVITCKGTSAKNEEATIELLPKGNFGDFQWRVK